MFENTYFENLLQCNYLWLSVVRRRNNVKKTIVCSTGRKKKKLKNKDLLSKANLMLVNLINSVISGKSNIFRPFMKCKK